MENVHSLEQLLGILEEDLHEDAESLRPSSQSAFSSIVENLFDLSCAEEPSLPVEPVAHVSSSSAKPPMSRASLRALERKRRDKLKDKLLALRNLVPFITKLFDKWALNSSLETLHEQMDKASIVGDAVVYVQKLQKQAMELEQEIRELDLSFGCSGHGECDTDDKFKLSGVSDQPRHDSYRILQLDVFRVEQSRFYVKVICSVKKGVALALLQAVESLACLHVQSSNMAAFDSLIVFTCTVQAAECLEESNELTLKMKLMAAFIKRKFVHSLSYDANASES
ncbi:Transcription factor FER-LIKE IRON DEFICIENCY-INDUCED TRANSCRIPTION FACTOR [Nymphaea thermarum]|nr:Transcription factor FER-LIKE IRON DEFICIENCY-INDUCED TRANSCRIPTION FACTOR [Nymphaea thermarum]